MKTKKGVKGFTLVELIVVITILAILGTIAFINLQGYSTGARDSKRLSDINNLQKKIAVEVSKGTNLSSLINLVKTNTGLTINNNSATSIQGTANFQSLKENGDSFKDPITGGDYILSYSVGGSGTGAYKFTQISTINEENNQAVVKGNYYQMQPSDNPSITVNEEDYFVIDGGVDLPYDLNASGNGTEATGNITMIAKNIGNYNCVLYSTGNIKCWGANNYGQIGDGTTIDRYSPVDVPGISNVVSIFGGYEHNAALLSDGTVKTWGSNMWGQLGDGTTVDKLTPITLPGLSGVTRLVEGFAMLNNGSLKYWGPNLSDFSSPAPVLSLTKAESHKCIVLANNTVMCLGNNWDGRLGDGTFNDSLNTLVSVVGINNAIKVITSNDSTCAILSDATVKCWGYNGDGELGDGTTNNSSVPVIVSGLSNVVDVIGGYRYNIAILNDGTLKAWGVNDVGQLGDGTTINRTTPVTIPGLSGVVSVNAGFSNTCALLSTGVVKCWGDNSSGQLGDGTTNNSLTPVTVQGL